MPILRENGAYYTFDKRTARNMGWAKLPYKVCHIPTGKVFQHGVFTTERDLLVLLDHWNRTMDWHYTIGY